MAAPVTKKGANPPFCRSRSYTGSTGVHGLLFYVGMLTFLVTEVNPSKSNSGPGFTCLGRAPVEAKVEDGVKPVNYGIMGSMPITRTAASSKTGVEFAKAGKIQLGEVVDVQELRRKLQVR